jgi:hypothetical protein
MCWWITRWRSATQRVARNTRQPIQLNALQIGAFF